MKSGPTCAILCNWGTYIAKDRSVFLRRCIRRKNGKRYPDWAWVESFRTAKGSRQRVMAYLGELEKSEKDGGAQLCRRLNPAQRPQPSLFDPPHDEDPIDNEPVRVQLENIRLERLRDFGDVWLALGRLKERYWRAASAFNVRIATIPEPKEKARLSITWTRNPRRSDWAAVSEGGYLLRTTLTDVEPATLWKRYIQLTEAEWAFRITKNELAIRPIWHQRQERVRAHIRACFLVYVLWKTRAQWMRRAGLGEAPRTLLEEFAKIKSGDVVLPARMADGRPRTIHLRGVTPPDDAQKVLLHRLGLTLPQRLRSVNEVEQM